MRFGKKGGRKAKVRYGQAGKPEPVRRWLPEPVRRYGWRGRGLQMLDMGKRAREGTDRQ